MYMNKEDTNITLLTIGKSGPGVMNESHVAPITNMKNPSDKYK
ncbi:unnamed protein product, partial [marine sediment metagenome]